MRADDNIRHPMHLASCVDKRSRRFRRPQTTSVGRASIKLKLHVNLVLSKPGLIDLRMR
jgi:hypothetical protein